MHIGFPGRLKILNLAALLTVLGSALSAVLQIESILLRWQVILLLGVFVGLQLNLPEVSEDTLVRRKGGLFVSLQALIITYLVLRTGIGFSFLVLFFILSTNIALYYPLRWVFAWIGAFILLTAFLNVRGGGWELLLLETAVYAAGYLFFGITTGALRSAQLAQAQSESLYQQQTYLVARQKELLERQEALLDELQLKNQQLEDYAQQAQTLAVVEERNRLSREMHDTLGHRLTSSAVQLEAAQRLLPTDRERAGMLLGEVRQEIRQALTELRQVVGRLREPVESELDLPQALLRMVERFQSASGIQVYLELPEAPCPFSPAQRLALYRSAQAGLTNVQRHAQATEARLRLSCTADEICLELSDNGAGLPERDHNDGELNEPTRSYAGFGLLGLQERAAALGGTVRLENAPGGGAVLTVCLPSNVQPCEDGRADSVRITPSQGFRSQP